jgi:Flp pilus assembly pilin Flp
MSSFGVALKMLLARLWRDQRGAALTEYTLLLVIIAVGVITLVGLVAAWVGGVWMGLDQILNPQPPQK